VNFKNAFFSTTLNSVISARIEDNMAIIHSDFIDNDPLYPPVSNEPVFRCGINAYVLYCSSRMSLSVDTDELIRDCRIMLTPVTDVVTGKVSKIVLRRVILYRYNLLPHDTLVQEDMKLNQSLINGDLLTAKVCQNLQQQRPDLIEMAAKGAYCT
jgi:hypothetical protein